MLDHLRERAAAAMAKPNRVTLATCGPAGIQSDALPCRVLNRRFFLLVPRTSDQLLNIEHREAVLVTAQNWQLRGNVRILPDGEIPAALLAGPVPETAWSIWVEVLPLRLTLFDHEKNWFETLDFEIPGGEENDEVL